MALANVALDSARANGDRFYFTGKPCANGHIANRYASNRQCVVCVDNRAKKDPAAMKAYKASWRIKNVDKIKAKERENLRRRCDRMRETYRNNPAFALRARIRAQLWKALRRNKQSMPSEVVLGYTMAELREHIERQFLPGMNWGNMGDWHIDHIIPLASFNITSLDDPEIKRAWGLPNLRPLWAEDNVLKSDKRVTLL